MAATTIFDLLLLFLPSSIGKKPGKKIIEFLSARLSWTLAPIGQATILSAQLPLLDSFLSLLHSESCKLAFWLTRRCH